MGICAHPRLLCGYAPPLGLYVAADESPFAAYVAALRTSMGVGMGQGTRCIHGSVWRTCTSCFDISPLLTPGLCWHRERPSRCRWCLRSGVAPVDVQGEAQVGYELPGIACPSSTATEPAAPVRLRHPTGSFLSGIGQSQHATGA